METTTPEITEEEITWTEDAKRFAGETNKEAYLATEHVVDVCEEIDNDCDHFENLIREC